MVLDKFVYDSDKKTGSIILDLTKGAFRFITGVASKPTYLIRTPNASITVRGTIFDMYVLPDDDRLAAAARRRDRGDLRQDRLPRSRPAGPADPGRQRRRGEQADQLEGHAGPRRRRFRHRISVRRRDAADRAPSDDDARCRHRGASFPDADPKACANEAKPKTRKAEDDDDKPTKKKKKRQASNDDDNYTPPARKKRKPEYEKEDDNGGGASGMDIIIRGGGGFGGGRPGGYGGGMNGGGRGMGGGGYGGGGGMPH